MKHTLCFIDDKIPVSQASKYFDETDIITGSMISYLLLSEEIKWYDEAVKQLCLKLKEQKNEWAVSAFTAPQFYEDYIKENVYAPEIIIYDWDFNSIPGSHDSENSLLEILRSSYTIVFVFSEAANKDEIENVTQSESFVSFRDRLFVVTKGEEDSINSIFQQFSKKEEEVFTYNYGHQLVLRSHKAINAILSDISQLSVESFVASFSTKSPEKGAYLAKNRSFVDTIIPRFRFELLKNEAEIMEFKETREPDLDQMRKVWSYRLFDNSHTPFVSQGDIIKQNDSGDCFLVISSDCHLNDFWHKNGGSITLVPMFPFESEKAKEYIKLIDSDFNPTSIANSKNHITVLPSVPTSDDENTDLILFPKCVTSKFIPRKNGYQGKGLMYKVFDGYTHACSLLDPFKSPIVEYVIDNISGYGCPDFPNLLKEDIKRRFKKARP